VSAVRTDVSVFVGLKNSTFLMRLPDGSTDELQLVEVDDLGHRDTPVGALSNYVLRFLARTQAVRPQAIYRLEHPALGAMDVFLVPVGRGAEGVRYEAVFN
jgi:hypothetical protein